MGKIIRNGIEYGDVSASCISFTPGGGLLSDNVQDAITELDTNKVDKETGKGLFSGSYTDLTDKPTIPAAQVNVDWNSSSGITQILNKPSLATVATSGSYNDLSNKPTIPAAQVNSNWNATSGVAQILNKPSLATVATSGSYNDLTNKPSIPAAVYMGTIDAGSTILGTLINTAPVGNTLWQTQLADDSPTKGSVSSVLMCKHTGNGTYSYLYHFNSNGVIRTASTGNPVPSSLTWTKIDARNANYANSAGSATDSTKEPKLSWTYKSSSGSWNYWKDSSGRYHMTYNSGDQSINFNGTIGSLKYRTTTFDLKPPFTMTSLHSIVASTCCANDITGVTVQSYTTTSIKLYLWAATAGTKTVNIHMDIITT